MNTAAILETVMILCFGISWPLSIARMYKSWSTGGKSILFSCFILLGYLCGICAKVVAHNYNLAFIFYIINTVMVKTAFEIRQIQQSITEAQATEATLENEILQLSSPAGLSERAQELGLAPASSVRHVDLEEGIILETANAQGE